METGSQHTGLVYRQWSLSISLSLSVTFSLSLLPCCSTHRLPNFLSRHIFPFCLCLALIFIHSCQSSLSKVSASILTLPLFIQSDIFTSPLIHSCQPYRHALTSLSLSPLVMSSSSPLSRHPSLSTCASSCLISAVFFFSFCPSFLPFKLCVWIECSNTRKHTQMLAEVLTMSHN